MYFSPFRFPLRRLTRWLRPRYRLGRKPRLSLDGCPSIPLEIAVHFNWYGLISGQKCFRAMWRLYSGMYMYKREWFCSVESSMRSLNGTGHRYRFPLHYALSGWNWIILPPHSISISLKTNGAENRMGNQRFVSESSRGTPRRAASS